MRIISLSAVLLGIMCMFSAETAAQNKVEGFPSVEFREAVRLYENGMYSRSRTLFEKIGEDYSAVAPEAYSVLAQVREKTSGYAKAADAFLEENPHSVLVPQIRWHYAMNLFDDHYYKSAGEMLASVSIDDLHKTQRVDYLFRKGYCDLENHDLDSAWENFLLVEAEPFSDYTLPSRYALGYIS